jgi:hypothetical protein
MSLAEDVRPISRTSPNTCQKIKYSNRNDTPRSCPISDHRWSATQARILAPRTVKHVEIDVLDGQNRCLPCETLCSNCGQLTGPSVHLVGGV